jgi:hypothetical protein
MCGSWTPSGSSGTRKVEAELEAMGHNRLQYPPDTQKWLPVVEAVADGADVASVAGATLAAVEKGLEQAKGDQGLALAVWLLAHIALAAREDDFQAALATKGVDVPAGATVVDIVAGLSDAMDRQLRATRGRTDIGEMAQLAAAESIAELVGRESTDLFGSREAVQEAFRSYSTKDGFGSLAHAFFSRFIERYLGYHLSRELSRHVGESQRFADPEAHSAFLDRMRSHSQQVALIVKQFSAGWHSKSKFETGISERSARGFSAYALTKIRDEIKRRGQRDVR